MIQSNSIIVEEMIKEIEAELKSLRNVVSISLDFSTTVIGNGKVQESAREEISITTETKTLLDISSKKVSVVESTLKKADNQIGEKFLKREI
ncbi:TIGR04197 family type VII secretion effector [Parvimonas sp. C2]|uniref:TIGR04197 family type VII secretion effector n=1 Tax=Parvimonas sp. C2 TaxID=3110692 RepID=UPI002B472ABB|nr:TIGR04197 family type VII secretion effector [Parvimonas sp. C2]MEB3072861.1 TIGR04197 family type VII secretion effector [Parvimonas sp. C2]